MRSLFSRLRGGHTSPPPRSSSSASEKDETNVPIAPLPPTQLRPTIDGSSASLRSATPVAQPCESSTSSHSTRPHSVETDDYIEPADNEEGTWGGLAVPGARARTSSEEVNGKKVTFMSPAPTPTDSVVLDKVALREAYAKNRGGQGEEELPNNGQRGGSSSTSKRPSAPSNSPRPPATSRASSSQSFASTRPRASSRQPASFLPSLSRPLSQRKVSMAPLTTGSALPNHAGRGGSSPTKSAKSPTSSEQSLGGTSARSYLPAPNSWGEMAEEELIANLGPRERTRQEVLWEIVSSEERYVQELIKLNETFCRALLPPSVESSSLDSYDPNLTLSPNLSPLPLASPSSIAEPFDHLPIAARYASSGLSSRSPSGDSGLSSEKGRYTPPTSATARLNAYHILTNGRPSEVGPGRKSTFASLVGQGQERSHRSLPPPPRLGEALGPSGISHNRLSYHPGNGSPLPKLSRGGEAARNVTGSSYSSPAARELQLPEDLARVLDVLAGGILEGHIKLAAALRKRYDDQYPLVRTLADVFTSHSAILREYATYVLHLEKALAQLEEALSLATSAATSKRTSKRIDDLPLGRLGKLLLTLEEIAAERGESGLSISLSKPFQRLLKYPLLFQNLLFNTDPSLKEYEATLAMVDDVEEIVRTIEDEKADHEDREKTRDVWARIEGLEGNKMLRGPKPNRLLISEIQVPRQDGSEDVTVRQKKSFKRLSDILKGGNEHSDLWVVRFSDVSLLCARTGLTQLPLSGAKKNTSRSDSLPEISGRAKTATMGKRSQSIRARNLYRFIKINEWYLKQMTASTEGLSLLMDDISRARQPTGNGSHPTPIDGHPKSSTDAKALCLPNTPGEPVKVPIKTMDGGPSPARSALSARSTRARGITADTDTIASDHQSVMSFAFNGGDQVRPITKALRPKSGLPTSQTIRSASSTTARPPLSGLQRRTSGGHLAGSAANAKFANRLRSPELEHDARDTTLRPTSRVRQSLPPAMARQPSNPPSAGALSVTDKNTNTNTANGRTTPTKKAHSKPAWNSSIRPLRTPPKSVAPSFPIGARRLAMRKGLNGNVNGNGPATPSEDGVIGLWPAYREGMGEATPRKPIAVGAGRGGRI